MLKQIEIPPFVKLGIQKNETAFPQRLRIWGADVETCNGKPITLQVYGDGIPEPVIYWVNKNNILDVFLEVFHVACYAKVVNIVYFHNLQFDLSCILYRYHKNFLNTTRLKINYKSKTLGLVKIDAIIGKLWFAKVHYQDNKKLLIYDTLAFIHGSLKHLAEQLKLPHKKLPTPENIVKINYNKTDTAFIEYAKNDAVVCYDLACWIIEQHKKFNIRICVSASQFSMRVFRHFFIKPGEVIQFPPNYRKSILSYHGGKNGYYFKGVSVVEKCYEIDIRSAYPYALWSLPQFIKGYFSYVTKFCPGLCGIYAVSGKAVDCKYTVIYDHGFKPVKGIFKEIYLTNFEIEEGLRTGELQITDIHGCIWQPDKTYMHNPFKEYVEKFYELKENSKTFSEKQLYKILLNSLYGKLVQTIDVTSEIIDDDPEFIITDEDGRIEIEESFHEHHYRAGGMFNPFLASLVTGFVRAYLHRLEHRYEAIHSSTDSIKTVLPVEETGGLGGLKNELCGKCVILRNKLYLHYDENEKLKKYALHGFLGTPAQLKNLYEKKINKYAVNEFTGVRLMKVRSAVLQGKIPFMQVHDEFFLKVNFNRFNFIKNIDGNIIVNTEYFDYLPLFRAKKILAAEDIDIISYIVRA